jgi:hypothetical protein
MTALISPMRLNLSAQRERAGSSSRCNCNMLSSPPRAALGEAAGAFNSKGGEGGEAHLPMVFPGPFSGKTSVSKSQLSL